ncbi:hypothetical protein L7F22_022151 [Adiantum nelumboides]|nr:hypothetical protein [Adiantum nelumboides]
MALLQTGTRGAVTGVGLEVGFDSGGVNTNLVVIAPVIGGPAERAGIVPGDIISDIDGMSTKGLGLYDVAQRLQGPESSEVKLTVQKKESGSSNTLVLIRERIKINPVAWRLCEVEQEGKEAKQIGYIRLATFNENASRSIKEAIQKLKESGATAFILDMRNNSGGLFPAGIEIARMWLEKGVIVYITDSMGVRDIYEADGTGTLATEEPLAVLVNKGTASASEILAGALKDNKRANILGEPTFGKGKIQSVFELSDGSGMAVTIARYETPAHVDIDKLRASNGSTRDGRMALSSCGALLLLVLCVGEELIWGIYALYEHVSGRVRCPGGISDTLVSTIGVKQGCLLSPTLFGLYIDEIVDFIQHRGGDGVGIGGTTIHILLYADDVVLVVESAEGLQRHLSALDDFCLQRGLSVNLGKTKILIFHTSAQVRRQSAFIAAGGSIEITGSYVYLGVTFTAASGAFLMT